MADKKITELQQVSAVTDGLSYPVDNGTQSYRATALQLFNYLIAKLPNSITTAMLQAGAVTDAKTAFTPPKVVRFTTVGAATYTPSAGTKYILLKMVGGGGGGGSFSMTAGTAGTATTFGTLSAGGGDGGGVANSQNVSANAAGGVCSTTLTNFTLIKSLRGQSGGSGYSPATAKGAGGVGGATPFGPGGSGGNANGPGGVPPQANTGAGGGGNPNSDGATAGAGGGGAGGYIEGIVSPVAASYSLSIGAKGSSAANPAVVNGSEGCIEIWEYFY